MYQATRALAGERDQGLRLVLRIDEPSLAGLPWEAMYDDSIGEYVCREEPLVRHVPVSRVAPPLAVHPPLRILGIASSPRGLARLDVEKEHEQLAHALDRPIAAGLIDLRWAPDATWPGLQQMLLEAQEAWHVVHFIGHGDFDSDSDTGVLALEHEDHRLNLVQARQFVTLLRSARPMPRLIVLNSCSGGGAGQFDLFSGTAAALVRGGVGAVAAMQFAVSDPAAIAFTRGFYTAIATNRGVDEAVSSGRTAIIGLSTQTLEWITPVLYLRGNEAQVFEMDTAEPITPTEGPSARRRWFSPIFHHAWISLLAAAVVVGVVLALILVKRNTPPSQAMFTEARKILTVSSPIDVKASADFILVSLASGLVQRIDPDTSITKDTVDFAARPGAGLLQGPDDIALPFTGGRAIGFVDSNLDGMEMVGISGGWCQNGALVPDGFWFVCQTDTGGFLVHMQGRKEIGRLPMPFKPFGVTGSEGFLYVTFADNDALGKVDFSNNNITTSGTISRHPVDAAIVNGDLWTTLSDSDEVAVVDTKTLRVKSRHSVGDQPWKILVGLGSVWVTNLSTADPTHGTVSRLDPITGIRQQADIPVGGRPDALAVDADAIYVANINDNTISVLRGS
jgi:YVTN family beta-propeller protein